MQNGVISRDAAILVSPWVRGGGKLDCGGGLCFLCGAEGAHADLCTGEVDYAFAAGAVRYSDSGEWIAESAFFAQAPDGRIFVTGMHDLSDNRLGSVFILEGWDEKAHKFARFTHYLDHLRNPNNLAFWTDPATKQSWLYLPLTDRLVRYKYNAGDEAPTSEPETLLRFPDYGLNYKYGGWHLTRTVAVAVVNGATRILVAAGSSCNYCREREVLRAAVVSLDPDGSIRRWWRRDCEMRWICNR